MIEDADRPPPAAIQNHPQQLQIELPLAERQDQFLFTLSAHAVEV